MKSQHPELTQRYLSLVKIDSSNLMERIEERQEDYLNDFSLKRDRQIFKDIFHHRYSSTSMGDLAHLPIEIIELTNDFYKSVDDLYWYLMHTQDMPNTIEEEIVRMTASLKKKHVNLVFYIDVELSGEEPPGDMIDPAPVIEESEPEVDSFFTEEIQPVELDSLDEGHEDEDQTREIDVSRLEGTSSYQIEDYDLEDDS